MTLPVLLSLGRQDDREREPPPSPDLQWTCGKTEKHVFTVQATESPGRVDAL